MSRSVDSRVVEMRFDNSQFEKEVATSQSTLEKLKSSLNMDGATKSLSGLSQSAKNFNLSEMENSLDNATSKFSTFEIMGITALVNLTNSAIDLGKKMGAALIDPITAGGKKRAINMEQAKFQFKGLGMDVEATMADANYAVLGTAYALDAAAKVASQLGASGMRAGEEMRTSLRAVSGVAAMTSSSYEDIGNVFTKVAGQGRLMGADLLRLSTRGMNAAAVIANFLGETEADVREMVTAGKIDFATFAAAMDDAFGEHATAANETFTGSLSNMRAALARMGAKFYIPFHEHMIAPLNSFRVVIDQVSAALDPMFNALDGVMGQVSKKADNFFKSVDLTAWKYSSVMIFDGLESAMTTIVKVLSAIGAAWKAVFPPKGNESVMAFGRAVKTLGESITVSDKALEGITKTFKGVFSVLSLVGDVIGFVVKAAISLFSVFTGKPLLDIWALSGAFGDFTSSMVDNVKNSKIFQKALDAMTPYLEMLSRVVGKVSSVLSREFNSAIVKLTPHVAAARKQFLEWAKVAEKELYKALAYIKPIMSDLGPIAEDIYKKFRETAKAFGVYVAETYEAIKSSEEMAIVIDFLRKVFVKVKEGVKDAVDGIGIFLKDFRKIDTTPVGDFSEDVETKIKPVSKIAEFIGKAISKVGSIISSVFKGIVSVIEWAKPIISNVVDAIKIVFKELKDDLSETFSGVFSGFEKDTAMDIVNMGIFAYLAYAIGQFVGAFRDLSGTAKDIGKAATGILNSVRGAIEAYQTTIKANAIKTIATAIALLAGSIILLAMIDPDKLGLGLMGVSVLMTEMVLAIAALSRVGNINMAKTAGAMVLLSVAIFAVTGALKRLGRMEWAEIRQGAVAVGFIVAALVVAAQLISKNAVALGVASSGLTALTSAITIMAGAMLIFSLIPEDKANQALSIMAGLMIGLLAFTTLAKYNADLKLMSASITAIASALALLVIPILVLGLMPFNKMMQGIIGTTAMLAGLGAALNAFPDDLMKIGSELLILSAALILMTGPIIVLSLIDSAKLASGMMAFVTALTAMATAITLLDGKSIDVASLLSLAGAMVVVAVAIKILAGIPAEALQVAVLAIVVSIASLAGVIGLLSLLGPALTAAATAVSLFGAGISGIGLGVALFAAGMVMMATVGGDGIANLKRVFEAGLDMLPLFFKKFGEGLLNLTRIFIDGIPAIMDAIRAFIFAFLDLVVDMIPQLIDGLIRGLMVIEDKIGDLMRRIGVVIGEGLLGLISGLLEGLSYQVYNVAEAFLGLFLEMLWALAHGLPILIDQGFEIIVDFINGLSAAIRDNAFELSYAFTDLGFAMLEGMILGLMGGISAIVEAVGRIVTSVIDRFKSLFGIESPSTEFVDIGVNLILGLIKGIGDGILSVIDKIKELAKAVLDTIKEFFGISSPSTELIAIGGEIIAGLIKGIGDGITAVVNKVKELGEKVLNKIKEFLNLEKFKLAATSAINGAVNGLSNGISKVVGKAKELGNKALEKVKEFLNIDKFKEVAGNVISGLISGLTSGVSSVIESAKELGSGALSGIKSFLGIRSPSREFEAVGKFAGDGFAKGMQGQGGSIIEVLSKMSADMLKTIKLLGPQFNAAGSEFMTQLANGMSSRGASVKTVAVNIARSAATAARSQYSYMYDAGYYMVLGFSDGISAYTYMAQARARTMAASAANAARAQLQVRSPSRVGYEIGEFFGMGFVNAIDDYAEDSHDAGAGIADSAQNGLSKAIQKIQDFIDNGIDTNPTIRPVLDLSLMKEGVSRMNDLLGGSSFAASRLGSVGVAQTGGVINIDTMIVRNDTDIKKIAEELYSLQTGYRKSRGEYDL